MNVMRYRDLLYKAVHRTMACGGGGFNFRAPRLYDRAKETHSIALR